MAVSGEVSRKIRLAAAAAALAAAGGAALAAAPAVASTAACDHGTFGVYCGTFSDGHGFVIDVQGGRAVVNTTVIAWRDEVSDRATDFAVLSSLAATNAVQLAYVPLGVWSGLCVSDPGGGFLADPGGPDGLVLRSCNGSGFQAWVPGSDGSLANVATGLVVTERGFAGQLVGAAADSPLPAVQHWARARA